MEEQRSGHWFVVHTLSGQEFNVQQSIEKRRTLEKVDDVVLGIVVPTEKVSEVRRGRKTTMERKFFPGYILVNMILYDAAGRVDDRAWYFVRETPGVIGFIGGEHPVPLSAQEVEDILAQTRQNEDASKPKVKFEVGDTVTIRDGPFENFEGVIESVDPDRGRLRLAVTIFGRSTPVEVEYWQVERT
jgi:transcriptional antiterminator NusG